MSNYSKFSKYYIVGVLLFLSTLSYAQSSRRSLIDSIAKQNNPKRSLLEADLHWFRGSIAIHNKDITRLDIAYPKGFIFAMQRKTFGLKPWTRWYNYPDYGLSFIYQDFNSSVLGRVYGLCLHTNLYFFKRKFFLRLGQGITYTSNPYDPVYNPTNIAYGSHLLSTSYILGQYKHKVYNTGLSWNLGLGVIHYSNGNTKAPNTSTNTLIASFGLSYNFNYNCQVYYIPKDLSRLSKKHPYRYSFLFSSGIGQNGLVSAPRLPFYTASFFVEKQLNPRSVLSLGVEMFWSNGFKQYIAYRYAGGFQGVTGQEDSKRAGVFFGHELLLNRFSIISQVGYYLYYPFEYDGRVYLRNGMRYRFTDRWFTEVAVRSHAANAEVVSFGFGFRW